MTRPARLHVFSFVSADEAGKTHKAFLVLFFTGDSDLIGINHDDEVAGIDMRSKDRLLFSAQKIGCLDRDVTEHLIFGIDQPPFTVDLAGFGRKRLHRRLEKGTETTGREGHCQPMESEAVWAPKVLSRNYNAPQYSNRRRSSLLPQFHRRSRKLHPG